jgi:hypothetical protein
MSITTTKQLGNLRSQTDIGMGTDFVQQLTVLTMVKTLLEIIEVKKGDIMDKETRKQFPMIAKEIILLAEQTQ